jgi:hypothetical protein
MYHGACREAVLSMQVPGAAVQYDALAMRGICIKVGSAEGADLPIFRCIRGGILAIFCMNRKCRNAVLK